MWFDVLSGRAVLTFGAPQRLWLLAVVSLVVLSILFVARRRPGAALAAATALRVGALALAVLVLAGLSVETREDAQELCIVLSEDVSASVWAAGERLRADLLSRLVPKLLATDQLGAVAFARQAEVVAWPSAPPRVPSFSKVKVDPSATRLAAGIEAAVPLCPEGSEKKIVLVTDGNETIGDARRAAAFARETDTRVYVEVPGVGESGRGLDFEKLTAPPLVREGSVFPLRAIVRSGFAKPKAGTLDILVNGELAAHESIKLDPGINVFEVPYQLHERGSYQLAARLTGEGVSPEERREVSLAVAGPIRALVITHNRDSTLGKALKLRDVDVEFREPGSFPKMEDLLQYHCVVVDDVPRNELSDEALQSLETYVKSFGGGFLMTGGPRSFGDKAYQKSAVERALPVNLVEQQPKAKSLAPMGIFLVVDRSNSMGYNSRRHDIRDGEKIRYAREAALTLVRQLRPEDRVGVIAFDSDPYVLGPLRPLSEQRSVLEDRISRLVPGGGTDFKAALEIATAQLVQSAAKPRHIILLTDGDTNRGVADHDAVIQAMARLGISVTTLRIGDDDVNLEFLQRISRDTGGRYYHVENIEVLPELLVNDSRQARGDKPDSGEKAGEEKPAAPSGGPLRPQVGEATEVLRGLAAQEIPSLRDVPETRLKSGADLVLYVNQENQKRPLLVTWQYGLGRAAAFPFDPAQPEAAGWAAWPGFAKLWSQLVRWAIREETPWETKQAIRFRDGNPFLEVQTFSDLAEGTIQAQVFTSPQRSLDLTLTPVEPRLYRAAMPPLPPGRYTLLLTSRDGDKTIVQKRDVLSVEAAADDSTSAELARALPDLELLREIATETGGTINPSIEELAARHGAARLVHHNIDWLLVPLALALLLGDIAIRMREEGR